MRRKVNVLVKTLLKKKLTVAFAESMTCGLAAHQLSTVRGTSEILIGGIVCYQEQAKHELLNVSQRLLRKYTAESQQVTDAMARRLSQACTADIYAAVTGLCAPGVSESKSKPVGTVFYTVLKKGEMYKRKRIFKGTPLQIRRKACEALYEFICWAIRKAP